MRDHVNVDLQLWQLAQLDPIVAIAGSVLGFVVACCLITLILRRNW